MKINENGKLEIDLEDICNGLSAEQKKYFIKRMCISPEVIDWVMDWICGEDKDGWWTTEHPLREELLARAQEKQILNPSKYNWTLIKNAAEKLRWANAELHLYYRLYHHPDKYNTTIYEFLGPNENGCPFTHKSEKLEKEIKEIINIVKEAVKHE